MIAANPFRWSDPSSWPWIVYVWLLLFAGGWIKQFYDAQRRKKAADWPTVTGRIDAAEIPPQKKVLGISLSPANRRPCPAELRYSYSVDGQSYSGKLNQNLPNSAAAQEFIRDLNGMPVTVHYDPHRASISRLLDASLQALLDARPPAPVAKDPVPGWLKPLLWPFVALSALGLTLSIWVHFGALLGRKVAPSEYFWMLHMGIFVVWLPAVLVQSKQSGSWKTRTSMREMAPGAPKWLNAVVGFFFLYAFINFAIFFFNAPAGKRQGPDTPPEVWRGFSGHWMLFYSAALAMLYSAAKSVSSVSRCVNGHPLPPGAAVCSLCGQPATPFR